MRIYHEFFGLGLTRLLNPGGPVDADAQLADVARVLADDQFAAGEPISERDPRTGYRAWSDRYNELEQPAA